ncbi:hypothetical protein HYH03_006416 [Edaphochlamys debaryana]|uniref:Uncharacterized protein n=1 Tax=Edaphochlamys debaryana TaxID=47281 RepID=A0A835Y797_9CHLO|nr:hypothetical protein HYH03_006416 [Edaphochlamys debaryana]|eukprot:KAG2495471.1 hypothetical protein HYH03_006416 [Edaphochlamys debaryana]
MSDQVLEQISESAVIDDEDIQPGTVYLLKWLAETWGEAGRSVIEQFLVFYALMLVGFLFLYFMMRSTTQLRELRKNIAETLREQRNRKFDEEAYRNLPGGGYF